RLSGEGPVEPASGSLFHPRGTGVTEKRDRNSGPQRFEDVDDSWVGQQRPEGTLAPCPEIVWMRSEVRHHPIPHGGQVITEPGAFDLIGTRGQVSADPAMEQIEVLLA